MIIGSSVGLNRLGSKHSYAKYANTLLVGQGVHVNIQWASEYFSDRMETIG